MKSSERDKRRSEAQIVRDVFRRLKADGTIVRLEVPLLGRSIDLVYLSGNELFSIEFKLNDWRHAIEQAKDHRLGIDFAYVCLPRRAISQAFRELLASAGVGLFFYCRNSPGLIEKVIEAPRSTEVWSVARTQVYKYVAALAAK